MSKYAGLFGSNPAPAKVNLFGEKSTKDDHFKDIESWRESKGVKTSANRINFILNGTAVACLAVTQISDIGEHHVNEATEANRCVDQVVSDFAALKNELEAPKTLILGAIREIETAAQPTGFFQLLRSSKPNWPLLRNSVEETITAADQKMKSVVKYHLDPFISGLGDAEFYLNKIMIDLDNTINALDYIIDRTKDQRLQDLARRRKEMFAKSLALMAMNKGQLDTMTLACEKAKHFAEELEMNIKPLIENILRTALLSDQDGEASMKDIQTKLKAIL